MIYISCRRTLPRADTAPYRLGFAGEPSATVGCYYLFSCCIPGGERLHGWMDIACCSLGLT